MKSKVAQKIMEETPEEVKSSARLYADKLVLENKIREALPRLQEIEKGQRFSSIYYGIVVATKVTQHTQNTYSIYGFDEETGLPRDNYYPRELELLGHPIRLNDVLDWLCKSKNYSCNMQDGNFYIFGHVWDLSSVFLADQSEELIKFLNEL